MAEIKQRVFPCLHAYPFYLILVLDVENLEGTTYMLYSIKKYKLFCEKHNLIPNW